MSDESEASKAVHGPCLFRPMVKELRAQLAEYEKAGQGNDETKEALFWLTQGKPSNFANEQFVLVITLERALRAAWKALDDEKKEHAIDNACGDSAFKTMEERALKSGELLQDRMIWAKKMRESYEAELAVLKENLKTSEEALKNILAMGRRYGEIDSTGRPLYSPASMLMECIVIAKTVFKKLSPPVLESKCKICAKFGEPVFSACPECGKDPLRPGLRTEKHL